MVIIIRVVLAYFSRKNIDVEKEIAVWSHKSGDGSGCETHNSVFFAAIDF